MQFFHRLLDMLTEMSPQVASAIVSALVAWTITAYTYRRNVRPILVFTMRGASSWHIENIGAGPAMVIRVGDGDGTKKWHKITAYAPLGARDKTPLLDLQYGDYLGAKYKDVNGNWYSTECADGDNQWSKGDKFKNWDLDVTEHEIQKVSKGDMSNGQLLANMIKRNSRKAK